MTGRTGWRVARAKGEATQGEAQGHHDSDEVKRQERRRWKEGDALKGSGNIRSYAGTADLTELEMMVGTTLAGGERG